MASTTRRSAVAGLLLVLALVLVTSRQSPPAEQRGSSRVGRELATATSPSVEPDRSDAVGVASVSVEKRAICRGEETLIEVTPFHRDPAAIGWLATSIGMEEGTVHVFRSRDRGPGIHGVPIHVMVPFTDERVTTSVDIEVRDCTAPASMYIAHRQSPVTTDPDAVELDVVAEIAADHYVWDFGDGVQEATTDRRVTHVYPPEHERPIDERASQYRVSVQALDGMGRILATARDVVRLNNWFRSLEHDSGRLQLQARYHPYSIPDESGVFSIAVELINASPRETAHLSDVTYAPFGCAKGEPAGEMRGPATQVFADATVGPLATIAGRFGWPASQAQGICMVKATLSGTTTPGGLRVQGEFRIRVGRSPRTKVIRDSELSNLLMAAQRASGKGYVMDEDIARLEGEGKLPAGTLDRKRRSLE